MSHNDDNTEGDLIDLGSPTLPRIQLTAVTADCDDVISDNLIDTELPVFERRLQTAISIPSTSRKSSLDIEDILITIDDDDDPVDIFSNRACSFRRSKSETLLEEHEQPSLLHRSFSCDNLEAINVLNSLDDILDASLLESNKFLNICLDGDPSVHEQSIEACLLDLDNYLRAFDSSNCEETSTASDASNRIDDASSLRQDASCSSNGIDDEDLRSKLRRLEENYSRFVALGIENRGYIESEGGGELTGGSKRPVSACGTSRKRKCDPDRATIGVVRRRQRVAMAVGDSDDDIDWSWVQEVERRNDERPPSPKDAGVWLRSSMRRLHRLPLPLEVPTVETARPLSAPSRLIPAAPGTAGGGRSSSASSRPRSLSSSVTSLASTVDSTPSCTPTHDDNERPTEERPQTSAPPLPHPRRQCERTRNNEMPETESPLGQWPHSLSSMMACLGCTLGLFNISRFALLTVHFGANFIFQFFCLSMVFGLPLFTLQLCLGQQLGAGVVDMWRISPLFQGVGVSLLVGQILIGLYSIIGVSWMFVFFRDSFITKTDKYRWAEPFLYYREGTQALVNGSVKLSETIPDYFSGVVLQRHHLASNTSSGTIKFQLAFNLAVVWMIVFVCLSKGLRSYGKVIYVFTLLPVFGTFILCAKILGMMPPEYVNIIFPETTWNEFFLNPKSWLAAAQEVFLTWGLLGTAVMQIASHNRNKHLLQRDSSLVAVITFTVLLLVAFLANTCVQILRSSGYSYLPNSFERMSSYIFLRPINDPLPPSLANTPVRYMSHNSFILGERVVRPGADYTTESGYQVLRLATELIPATFAVLGPNQVSPFWSVLFYFILILFGIAQQLAIWHCVITGIMAIKAKLLKSWETTITLFSCACGFILGLPMATEFGIYVVYFLDYTIGGMWWLIFIILLQIVAVFMVRGRPYSGDTVVTALFTSSNHPCLLSWAPPLLSFTWNVILPVALMVLCITTFKNGNFRDIFVWHHAPVPEYWPLWARQVGSMIQLIPILLVPLIAVIQSYRYLNNGPSDILDRIQLLYRPPIGEHMTDLSVHDAAAASANGTGANPSTGATSEDPPPKYTPPPSYTTATGARIAKFLRQSIRRSVRRLANVLGESSNSRQRASIQNQEPPPPDYNTVLVEMNQTAAAAGLTAPAIIATAGDRMSTLERLRNIQTNTGSASLTAAEVASILRSSFRRSTRQGARGGDTPASLSAENLVDSAAPIGETSLVMDRLPGEDVEIKCG